MSQELDETNQLFGYLPIDAQNAFSETWKTTTEQVIARRGLPDPVRAEGTEMLAKLYFIHGYVASQKALRSQFKEIKNLVSERITAFSKNEE